MNATETPLLPDDAARSGRAALGRRIRLTLVGMVALVLAGAVFEQRTRPTLVWGPMIQIPKPQQLTIVWEMRGFFETGGVHIRDNLGGEAIVHSPPVTGSRYEFNFPNLKAGLSYTYEILNRRWIFGDRVVAGPFATHSSPPPARPFRFIAFGDSGNGSLTQAALVTKILEYQPELVIHVGDLVYPAGSAKDYLRNFFEPNAALIRSVPFMPCLGNHDVATDQGRPLLDTFVLPRNGPAGLAYERNYWFDYGPARFVALDSNPVDVGGAITEQQRRDLVAPWLHGALTNCRLPWKFVYFHHPFYTGSEHPPEGGAHMKAAIVSILEKCRVDIVFCGHNHLYERTDPIREDRVVEEGRGVVYVTTGAGGVSRYPENLPPPPYMRAYHDSSFSFTVVDLFPDRLQLRQIDENGRQVDEMVIVKASARPPSPSGASGSSGL